MLGGVRPRNQLLYQAQKLKPVLAVSEGVKESQLVIHGKLAETELALRDLLSLRIGDIVEYQLTVVLPEGQSNNVVITDTLPSSFTLTVAVDSAPMLNQKPDATPRPWLGPSGAL